MYLLQRFVTSKVKKYFYPLKVSFFILNKISKIFYRPGTHRNFPLALSCTPRFQLICCVPPCCDGDRFGCFPAFPNLRSCHQFSYDFLYIFVFLPHKSNKKLPRRVAKESKTRIVALVM